jgi:autotransporter-associated beta strand protein/T5SS/PEP-CTERM-associated repeat protein
VADLPDRPANLVLDNATLTTASWIAIGRGNGDNGVTNLTATNSTINSVNYSTGFNNGLGNNQSEAFVTLNDSTWNNNGLTYLAESSGSQGVMTLNGNSKYNITNNFILARFLGTTATVNLNGTSSVTKTGGYTAIGNEGTAVMNVNDSASFTALSGDFNVGDIGSSNGTINLAGSGLVNVTQVFIGKNITTTGTLNQTGGTFQSANFITIGAFTGGTGTVNISAGSLTAATNINVGQSGNGTLNVSGSAQVTASGDAVFIGSAAGGTGTLNLNGGTVTAKRVGEGAAATSTLNFNGGLLKAAAGANAAFIGPVDNAVIQPGGAFIDTSGQNLSVTAALGGTGALTKSGAGTLTLSGGHSYGGNTTVTAGTLALSTATLADSSTVTIAAGAALNLPHGASDTVAGLVINGSSLGAGVYSAATHPGIITGTGSLNVTGTGGSPYDTWIAGFPSIPAADRDPGDDPDGDGATNAMEFALGGIPNSGSSRPKVYPLVADSSADGDTTREMLLTIAVLSGTPAFSGSPSPTATQSGYTYAIEGSTTLGAFTAAAVPVTPVVTGLPAAPAGYEYRTFSLSGSNGVPGKGFLRVNVTP